MDIVICFLLSLPVLWYAYFYYSRRRLYELAALIPGVPELPLIGSALHFYGNTVDITNYINGIITLSRSTKGVVKVWVGPRLYIGVVNLDAAETVLTKELNKGKEYRFLKPWMGNGLICGELPIWKSHRKRLMPSFHQKILDTFIETFSEKSEIMGQKIANAKGRFNVIDFVAPCNLDIICATAMGVELNSQKNSDTPYIRATIAISKLMYRRMFQAWLHPDRIFKLTSYYKRQTEYIKTLRDFTKTIMQMKKQQIINKKIGVVDEFDDTCVYMGEVNKLTKRKAFLDMLMDGDTEWTDQELQEEVDTMTTAGNDVTTHSTCFALMLIGAHQDVQEKLYEEIYSIFGDSDRPILKEDLNRMPYLERVIKETIRLFPTAPVIVRHLENEIQLEDYTLPADVGCIICIYGIHRDPNVWGENADDFNPDNFLPEKCAARHPCAFIPFSFGPRNCIGKVYAMMSMKVMLANIIRKAKLFCDVDHRTMETAYEILIKPLHGYTISAEPRLPRLLVDSSK